MFKSNYQSICSYKSIYSRSNLNLFKVYHRFVWTSKYHKNRHNLITFKTTIHCLRNQKSKRITKWINQIRYGWKINRHSLFNIMIEHINGSVRFLIDHIINHTSVTLINFDILILFLSESAMMRVLNSFMPACFGFIVVRWDEELNKYN